MDSTGYNASMLSSTATGLKGEAPEPCAYLAGPERRNRSGEESARDHQVGEHLDLEFAAGAAERHQALFPGRPPAHGGRVSCPGELAEVGERKAAAAVDDLEG